MDSQRMLQTYNSSRKYLGYPYITVIVDDKQWDIPVNVKKDPVYDGWYTDTGNEIDPSTFWKTVEMEVALSLTQSSDMSFTRAGEVDEMYVSYFTTIDNIDLVKKAYGFIIEEEVYKLEQLNIIPIPSIGVLIDFRVKKWD